MLFAFILTVALATTALKSSLKHVADYHKQQGNEVVYFLFMKIEACFTGLHLIAWLIVGIFVLNFVWDSMLATSYEVGYGITQ